MMFVPLVILHYLDVIPVVIRLIVYHAMILKTGSQHLIQILMFVNALINMLTMVEIVFYALIDY